MKFKEVHLPGLILALIPKVIEAALNRSPKGLFTCLEGGTGSLVGRVNRIKSVRSGLGEAKL